MYEAKLTGLKPKDVMFLISALPAHVDCKFAQTKQAEPEKKANGKLERVGPNDYLMLGDVSGQRHKGSLTDLIVTKIEKHEKKHGAATMTRSALTEQLTEFSDAPGAAISAALAKGTIKGVSA